MTNLTENTVKFKLTYPSA